MTLYHGTTVELNGIGLFIKGASGAGKSDLAIRLMDEGAYLIADDYTDIVAKKNNLLATAPDSIKGLIEAYGIGLLKVPAENIKNKTQIKLVVELLEPQELERLPDPQVSKVEGVDVPLIFMCAKQPSAVAKLKLYLKSLE